MKPKQSTTPKQPSIPRTTAKPIRDTSRDNALAQAKLHRFGTPTPTKPGTKI